jgi:hypothetical protein
MEPRIEGLGEISLDSMVDKGRIVEIYHCFVKVC